MSGAETAAMTTDDVIAGVIAREGGFVDNPLDRGGPTKYGITARMLGRWRGLGRPATADEVRALSTTEATDIYRAWYVAPFAAVADERLRAQLADFAVTSGVGVAATALQHLLGADVDGVVGPQTAAAAAAAGPLVHAALVAARVRYLERVVDRDPSQLGFLHGWIRRAVLFA
jgi:lysozyme family protein